MSEATARLERRAIRRAVGPELLNFTSDTAKAIGCLLATDQEQAEQIARLEQAYRRVTQLTLWQRLRWLATGHLEPLGAPLPHREFLA